MRRKWAWSRPRLGRLTNRTQGAKSAFQQQSDESFCFPSLCIQSSDRTSAHYEYAMKTPSQVGISKNWYNRVWIWGYLSLMLFCCVQGRQPSVLSALMSWFLSQCFLEVGRSDEECNFFWVNFPLRSLMSGCHTWLPSSKTTGKSGKM